MRQHRRRRRPAQPPAPERRSPLHPPVPGRRLPARHPPRVCLPVLFRSLRPQQSPVPGRQHPVARLPASECRFPRARCRFPLRPPTPGRPPLARHPLPASPPRPSAPRHHRRAARPPVPGCRSSPVRCQLPLQSPVPERRLSARCPRRVRPSVPTRPPDWAGVRTLGPLRFRNLDVRLPGFRFRGVTVLRCAVAFIFSRRFRSVVRALCARIAGARRFRRVRRACAGVRIRIRRLRRIRGVDGLGGRGFLGRRGLLGPTVVHDRDSDIATSKLLNRGRTGRPEATRGTDAPPPGSPLPASRPTETFFSPAPRADQRRRLGHLRHAATRTGHLGWSSALLDDDMRALTRANHPDRNTHASVLL